MGCSASSLVAAEDCANKGDQTNGGAPGPRPRQARLSLAGGYNQFEANKSENANTVSGTGTVDTRSSGGGGVLVRYAFLSQRGYYPDSPNKANQDAVDVIEAVAGDAQQHVFGVLDGHGEYGAECAVFAKAKFASHLAGHTKLGASPEKVLRQAMLATNMDLHKSMIDDSLSGTTACVALLHGDTVHVANVGDSRAVLAQRVPAADGKSGFLAVPLSSDQTPFRADERQRVQKAGARVLTLDQVEGLKDAKVQCWTDEDSCDGDPPRIWAPAGTYPGTAFTRSIGDSLAEAIGVVAEPELTSTKLQPDHAFMVVASDGIWEFLPSQRVVDMVAAFPTPEEAAKVLVAAAYKAWLQKETRTDDISIIVMHFDHAPKE